MSSSGVGCEGKEIQQRSAKSTRLGCGVKVMHFSIRLSKDILALWLMVTFRQHRFTNCKTLKIQDEAVL